MALQNLDIGFREPTQMYGLTERYLQNVTSATQRLGAQVRADVLRNRTMNEIRGLGEEMQSLDPKSEDFMNQAAQMMMRYPLAAQSDAGLGAMKLLASQHSMWNQLRMSEVPNPEYRGGSSSNSGITTSGGSVIEPPLPSNEVQTTQQEGSGPSSISALNSMGVNAGSQEASDNGLFGGIATQVTNGTTEASPGIVAQTSAQPAVPESPVLLQLGQNLNEAQERFNRYNSIVQSTPPPRTPGEKVALSSAKQARDKAQEDINQFQMKTASILEQDKNQLKMDERQESKELAAMEKARLNANKATATQVNTLDGFGIPYDDNLTKAQANQLIRNYTDAKGTLQPKQMQIFNTENSKYVNSTAYKNASAAIQAFNNFDAAYKLAEQEPNGANSVALIDAFNKIQNPGGVVRTEFFKVTKDEAQGIFDKVKNIPAKALSGNIITPKFREQMKQVIEEDVRLQGKSFQESTLKQRRKSLEKSGITPTLLENPYSAVVPVEDEEQPTAPESKGQPQSTAPKSNFEVGKVYRNSQGQRAKYSGKDAQGNDIWVEP